jgi:dihydropteroate synthase
MFILENKPPLIMGILNVTPDSFSDGGDFNATDAAVRHALEMVDAGADIIDIGGESTRPGAQRITADEQVSRVIPVLESLKDKLPAHVGISIDTTLARVANAALQAGAVMINDISAGEEDPELFALAAATGIPIILMHKQGMPESMQENPSYTDVVMEIRNYLLQRAGLAVAAGIEKSSIILDPGIGFGKTQRHNLQILANLPVLTGLGYPLLLGASRKTTLASICKVNSNKDLVGATCTTTAAGVFAGVSIFRVHDVKENRQAADVAYAIKQQIPKNPAAD